MPYDEVLANRMRPMLLPRAGVSERNMFGGIGFFVFGNMCCGIWKNLFVARVGLDYAKVAVKMPHVRVMDITGKPMKGWILVEPRGCKSDSELLGWINKAVDFASTLPRKGLSRLEPKPKKR